MGLPATFTRIEPVVSSRSRFEQRFNYKTVWNWLKKCAGVLRVPRPVHEKRDSAKAEAFLEQIKKQYPDHEHVVVWDGAGFHPQDASHERIPEGIHLVRLPAYSPELNPI